MQQEYDANAYKQAYIIANFLIDIGEIVMSQDLLDILESKMNRDYYFDVNDIEKVELLPDTEKILTEIYLECIVSEKEKGKINKLVCELRKIILPEKTKNNVQNSLIVADLTGLKFWEKIRIRLNRLSSYGQE